MVECALYAVPGAQITKFSRDEDDSNNGMVHHNANDLTLNSQKVLGSNTFVLELHSFI